MTMQEQREQNELGTRSERINAKIERSVLEIIMEEGISGVTIESIARHAGVAKTTIYRRYANTEDLLNHLPLTVEQAVDFSAINPSHHGLHDVLMQIVSLFDKEFGLKAIGAVLSSSNATLLRIAHRTIAPAARGFTEFLTRGQHEGVFRGGLDYDFLFQTAIGSMLSYKALSNESSDHWANQMTSLLWSFISKL